MVVPRYRVRGGVGPIPRYQLCDQDWCRDTRWGAVAGTAAPNLGSGCGVGRRGREELLVEVLDGPGALPGLEAGAEVTDALAALCELLLGHDRQGLAGQAAGLVDLALLHVRRGEVGDDDGAVLDVGGVEPLEGLGELGLGALRTPQADVADALVARQAGLVEEGDEAGRVLRRRPLETQFGPLQRAQGGLGLAQVGAGLG